MIINTDPFFHIIIDNFFDIDIAKKLASEFPGYDDPRWFHYNNAIEKKKTINYWHLFPAETYRQLSRLCSYEFIEWVKSQTGIANLYPDIGLHGGGWHLHGRDDKLNIHKDYSVHPKLDQQRKLNLIAYLTPDWCPDWGGGLELWSHDSNHDRPAQRVTTVDCLFNRAIIFDTTQNSWHGLPNPIKCPSSVFRQSLAVYYLTDKTNNVDPRQRAKFVPTEQQQNDQDIIELCERRSK